jgi:pentatricopeptide repeat protein
LLLASKQLLPDAYCNALIEGSSNAGQHDAAITLLEEMRAVGLKPSKITNSYIKPPSSAVFSF